LENLEHLQNTAFLEPIKLISTISPDNISLLITLKVPRYNKDSVPNTHPYSLLHSARNATYPDVTILTSHSDSIIPEHLYDDTEYLTIISIWYSNSDWFIWLGASSGQNIPPKN
jgi:hypothetical protein